MLRADQDGRQLRAGRRGAHRARRPRLRLGGPPRRPAGGLPRRLPAARRQRAGDRRGRSRSSSTSSRRRFPAGIDVQVPFDTTRFVEVSIEEVLFTLGDRDGAGVPGRLPLPAELPRHAHPDDRGAGVADRHLRRHVRAGLLDQHSDALRPGAGDRHRRRRRHRRAREHRAPDGDREAERARRRLPVDARGDRAGGGDRARALLGVRAGRLPRRPRRASSTASSRSPIAISVVDLGAGGADPDAGALRPRAARAARGARVLRRLQPLVRALHRALRRARSASCSRRPVVGAGALPGRCSPRSSACSVSCPAASCRRRTRATSSPLRCCPTAPPCRAPALTRRADRADAARRPGGRARGDDQRLRLRRRRQQLARCRRCS